MEWFLAGLIIGGMIEYSKLKESEPKEYLLGSMFTVSIFVLGSFLWLFFGGLASFYVMMYSMGVFLIIWAFTEYINWTWKNER